MLPGLVVEPSACCGARDSHSLRTGWVGAGRGLLLPMTLTDSDSQGHRRH